MANVRHGVFSWAAPRREPRRGMAFLLNDQSAGAKEAFHAAVDAEDKETATAYVALAATMLTNVRHPQ